MTPSSLSPNTQDVDFSFVAAVNNEIVLNNNLLRSSAISLESYPLKCYRYCNSASRAYNIGIKETLGAFIVFVHQDVFLPHGWLSSVKEQIEYLNEYDPSWAVMGCYGRDAEGAYVGHVWSSGLGKRLGESFAHPIEVESLDELLIVMRHSSGLRFDYNLPGFHLYGTDIVQLAKVQGMKSYVADIPVIHNSQPVRQLRSDYSRAYNYMRKKWHNSLPIFTPVVTLSKNPWPLTKLKLKLAITEKKRLHSSYDANADPRSLVNNLDIPAPGDGMVAALPDGIAMCQDNGVESH